MSNINFHLTVDGENVDVRSLMCHYQDEPYPGGRRYHLLIGDADVISTAKDKFGGGTHRNIESSRQSSFLSYLAPAIALKCGRTTFRFWANTIDEIEISDRQLVLSGVCSPHVEK